MLKLNLGCADKKLEGYINIDKYADCDLKIDVLELDKHFKEVDLIYGNGILEHLGFEDGKKFLKILYKILKNEGEIILEGIPDLEYFCKDFLKYPAKRLQLLEGFYGNQKREGQYHLSAYSFDMLYEVLKEAGFKEIKILRYAKRVFRLHCGK